MTHDDPNWTPEDDFRRFYPAQGARLALLPLVDLAEYVYEIERELKDGERIIVELARDLRSEANLTIRFPNGCEMHYMLVKQINMPPDWRPTGFTPA